MAEAPQAWLPWDEVFTFAVMRCALSPDAFWALSLPELRCLLGHTKSQSSLWPQRDTINDLMARFPDHLTKEAPYG